MSRIVFLSVFLSLYVNASDFADAFIVDLYDSYVKVVSPEKLLPTTSVIVTNKTIMRAYTRIMQGNRTLKNINLAPLGSKRHIIKNYTGADLKLVPLSPAFETIHLVVGKDSYEVPSKR